MLAVQSMMTLLAGSWMLAKWYVKESRFASVSCGRVVILECLASLDSARALHGGETEIGSSLENSCSYLLVQGALPSTQVKPFIGQQHPLAIRDAINLYC